MDYTYEAFIFKQRPEGPSLAVFLAPAGEVGLWSTVDRLSPDNPLAAQREPAPARIASIRRFFADDPKNTIPTAIVIGLDAAVAIVEDGAAKKLTLSTGPNNDLRPGLIIDGQHRLRGMEAFDEHLEVPIVGILDADDLEVAFQFLVINNKSARVPRDHLRALALNYQKDQLEARLKTARLSLNENLGSVGVLDEADESPFRGMVAWPNNAEDDRIVVPAAIEAMAAEARSLGFSELEDQDTLNGYLIAIWTEIKDQWPELFVKGSKLLSKVGLTCMTRFVSSTIKSWVRSPKLRESVNVGDPEKVRANTREIVATLDPRFFQVDWKSTSYDTRAGRDLVLGDLEAISFNLSNGDLWSEGLRVIDSASLDNQGPEAPAA